MLPSTIQHREFEPPEALRDAIKCFWYNSSEHGEQQTGFEVVPDGYAEIIFILGMAAVFLIMESCSFCQRLL